MIRPTTILDEALEQWYTLRRSLIQEIRSIPAARLSFRATLESRSVAEIAQHILEYAIVVVEEIAREDTNFHRGTLSQLSSVYAPNISRADTQDKIIGLFVDQYKDAEQRIRALGELHMLQLVTRSDGWKETRFSLLMDTIQHEAHHRGQLVVATRLLGHTPATSQDPGLGGMNPSFSDDSLR
jgi:uncharacterized damage-inducible protein DinB